MAEEHRFRWQQDNQSGGNRNGSGNSGGGAGSGGAAKMGSSVYDKMLKQTMVHLKLTEPRTEKTTSKRRKPDLIKKDVTRVYKVPSGPFKTPEDVVRAFGYELEKELDRGGFGVVYIARDLRKGIKVACKSIEVEPSEKEVMEENKNELLIMEKVRHPYVIPVYCHFVVQGVDENKMYIFMGLADGGNMYKFLEKKEKQITESRAKLYFAQIISGINHMHGVGIAHRDIKLQNILLCSNSKSISGDYLCVVTDFGLSKRVRRNQMQTTYCGTPSFMAPELIKRTPYDAYAVDVWALGITLYMMFTLESPFGCDESETKAVKDMMDENYDFSTFKPEPSEELKDLIQRMLDPDPKTRIRMLEIINHTWIHREYLMAKLVSNTLKFLGPAALSGTGGGGKTNA